MIGRRITHQGLRSFRIVRGATGVELEGKIQIQQERWAARFNRLQVVDAIQQKQDRWAERFNNIETVQAMENGEKIALRLKSELEDNLTLIQNLLKSVVEGGSATVISETLRLWARQADEVKDKVSRRTRIEALDDEAFCGIDELCDGLEDPLYRDAVKIVLEMGKASTSTLQRRLRTGYGRADRILDMMQREGIIGPPDGSAPREVLKQPDWLFGSDGKLP